MELHGSNVVQVADQREGAAAQLVIPHFNLVIVTTADKQMPEHKEQMLRMKDINCARGR
jgi:hypothetical protein